MKFNILINQKAIVDNGFDLDLIDAAIISYFVDFAHTGKMKTIHGDGKVYYWVDYDKIIAELPLLGIKTKDALYRRIKKIVLAGILEPHANNQKMCTAYFCFGNKYHLLVSQPTDEKSEVGKKFKIPTDVKPNPTDEKSDTYGLKVGAPTDEKSDNYTTSNNTTNHTTKIKGDAANAAAEIEPLKIPLEEEKEKAPQTGGSGWYQKYLDVYYEFFKQHNGGISPMITGADGKALKSLIAFLSLNAKNKSEQGGLDAFEAIFSNWGKLDSFLQGQIKLTQINSNINNIITQIKNGHGKSKQHATSQSNDTRKQAASLVSTFWKGK